ncbi:MAG: hypothetical protein ACRDO1_07565 [Nocardioidaceae bacterium]
MKFLRFACIVPLVLVSLLNVGYPFGADPKPEPVLAIAAVALGVAGFVAALGLARNATWGIPAALAVGALNVVGALIALVTDSEGAIVGLVISMLALVLAFVAGVDQRKVSPA